MKRSSVVYVARYWLARAYDLRGLDADALRLANVLLGMYPNETSALVIRLRVEAREGEIVVALIEGARATLKRLFRFGPEVELRPANSQLAPIRLPASKVAVQGIFRGLMRQSV